MPDQKHALFLSNEKVAIDEVIKQLEHASLSLEVHVATSLSELEPLMLDRLAWDLIIADASFIEVIGDAFNDKLGGISHNNPIIVLSDLDNEVQAARLIDQGANAYLDKRDLSRFIPVVKQALESGAAERKHHSTEEDLILSDDFLSAVLDNISDGIVACDADGVLSLFNRATRELHGLPEKNLPAKEWADHYDLFHSDGVTPLSVDDIPLFRAFKGEVVQDQEMIIAPKGREPRRVLSTGVALYNDRDKKIGAVCSMRDVTKQWEAERKLHESELRFRSAFDSAGHGIALVGLDGGWLDVNDALCGIVGYTREELLTLDFQTITHPDDLDADLDNLQAVLVGRMKSYEMEKRYIRKDGSEVPIILSVGLVRNIEGEPSYFVSQIVDQSERRAMEQKLAQAQKMEAVGQLTGGIAHDFNNLLTVILSNLDMIERWAGEDEKLLRQIHLASSAAGRGADLTRRLLAFARRQILDPVLTDVNTNLESMTVLLTRSMGDGVVLKTDLEPNILAIKVDPTQLETSILNLAINARDAMEGTGVLALETRNVQVDEAFARQESGLTPGPHVCVTVSDNGSGIANEDIERVFEPFFTTKDVGKGTGLGLSMVYGFVKQSGGNVTIYSEEGIGTSIRLYFPAIDNAEALKFEKHFDQEVIVGGNEHVLVVEDEPSVRETIAMSLETAGYTVYQASDGADALTFFENDLSVDLMITDVVMPGGINGIELSKKALGLRPQMKVLVTSGYPRTSFALDEIEGGNIDFVSKPYERDALTKKVRALLDK